MILLCPVIVLVGTLMLLAIMFIPRHIYHFFRPVRRPTKQDKYWPPLYGNPVAKCCCSSERDLYMYDDAFHKPGICPECGGVVTQEVNPEFKVKLKDWKDLFFTSDGYCIASSRFKQFCEAQGYENVTFVPLEPGSVKNGRLRNVFLRFFIHTFCIQSISPYKEVQEDFFWMKVKQTIPLDLNRELVRTGVACPHCHLPSVIQGFPYLQKGYTLESQDFIAQSDHMWGVDKFRYHHIIIGNRTFEKMKEYGLRGIDIWDVFE